MSVVRQRIACLLGDGGAGESRPKSFLVITVTIVPFFVVSAGDRMEREDGYAFGAQGEFYP